MAENKKRDKLSRYFKDFDEIELCESDESDEEHGQRDGNDRNPEMSPDTDTTTCKKTGKPENISLQTTKTPEPDQRALKSKTSDLNPTKLLPSAHECLKSQNAPAFLNLDARKEVDWNTIHKSIEAEDTPPQNYEKNAVPPPASYEPVTDPGIKVVDSEGRKRKNISDDLQDQMTSTKAYKVEEENS